MKGTVNSPVILHVKSESPLCFVRLGDWMNTGKWTGGSNCAAAGVQVV